MNSIDLPVWKYVLLLHRLRTAPTRVSDLVLNGALLAPNGTNLGLYSICFPSIAVWLVLSPIITNTHFCHYFMLILPNSPISEIPYLAQTEIPVDRIDCLWTGRGLTWQRTAPAKWLRSIG